ncbi:MAG: hypothetical protein FJZ57_03850 [Chlamydiae bacterium]|nr:hypothetical protein [Chlamydiota bacterium]
MTKTTSFNANPILIRKNYDIYNVTDSVGLKVRTIFGNKDYILEPLENLESLKPQQKICGERFKRLIILAANYHTESLDHDLLKDRDFQLFSATIAGAESLQTKKLRAIHKAIYLSFGTSHPYFSYKILETKYWQEALLPDHPNGTEINDLLKIWARSSSSCSFEAFLYKFKADQGVSKVRYLNPVERVEYAVDFVDGKIYKNGHPFHTDFVRSEKSNHSAIYAILPDEKMYIGPYITGKFHHSSFNSGQPVLGAGEIITKSTGEIKSISSKSGHFKPCAKQLLETLKYLEEKKVNLSEINLIENSIDSLSHHPSAETFLVEESERIGSPRERQSPLLFHETTSPSSPYLLRRIPSASFSRSNGIGWDITGSQTPSPSYAMFLSNAIKGKSSPIPDQKK